MSWELLLKKLEKDENPYNWILGAYRKWGREMRRSHEDIGISQGSLYKLIANHGKERRKGAKGSVIGAGAVIDRMVPFMQKQDLSPNDAKKILANISYLKSIEDSKTSNPQNIQFSTPKSIKNNYRSKEKIVTFGHYQTPHYVETRKELGRPHGKAVPDDWYSDKPNEAKSPMWQALFAGGVRGNSKQPIVTKGLLTILEEYEEHIKDQPKETIIRAMLKNRKNYRLGTNVLNYQRAAKFLADRGIPGANTRKIENMILEEMGKEVKNFTTPNGGKLRLKTVGSAKAKRYGLRKSWMEWLK